MEKTLQKIYLTYHNLLIAQDLWQAHYQILLIMFLKEFIEPNGNTGTMIKNAKLVELNISTVYLEYTNFKDGLIEYKCLSCNKSYQRKFDEKFKERFFNAYKIF